MIRSWRLEAGLHIKGHFHGFIICLKVFLSKVVPIEKFVPYNQRGLICTENKSLGRLCNPCFYEFWVVPSVNVSKLICRSRICKFWRSPVIDSKKSIPPANVAWQAGTSNRVVILAHPQSRQRRYLKSRYGGQEPSRHRVVVPVRQPM